MLSRGNFSQPSAVVNSVDFSEFDTSEDEDETRADSSPFEIYWLELNYCGYPDVGLSIVPGCKIPYKRNLNKDLDVLDGFAVRDVFVLCSQLELSKYGASDILNNYESRGIHVHHYPILEDYVPSSDILMKILEDLRVTLRQGNRVLIHGIAGLGRTCCVFVFYAGLEICPKECGGKWLKHVAACLLQYLDDQMTPNSSIEMVRRVRGRGAIQYVKQFNLIQDFRELQKEYLEKTKDTPELRPISR